MTSCLFLDFDGVLFDTAYECAVVTWCVRHGVRENYPGVTLDERFLRRFYDLKPYIRRAREYAVFASDAYLAVTDQASLDAVIARDLRAEELEAFEKQFYAMRERIKAASFDWWIGLNRPYPWAVDLLRARQDRTVVVSLKDGRTIGDTLGHWHLTARRVCDHAYAPTKRDAIVRVAAELGLALPRSVFVDDNVDHLLDLRAAGVVPVLADWGYVTPSQRRAAVDAGIEVATRETIASILARTLSG